MMRTFLIRCSWFLLLVAGSSIALDRTLLIGLSMRTTHTLGSWNRLVDGRMDAQVLFTGSSRCLMHYDAEAIGERLGKRCYNLGMDGSQLTLQLPWLRTYLKHNPPPHLIVQQVDVMSLVPDSDVFFPSQYPPYLREDPIFRTLERLDPTWWKDSWIPLYSFHRFGYAYAGLAIDGLLANEDTANDPLVLGHEKRDWKWDGTFDRYLMEHPEGRRYGIRPAAIATLDSIITIAQRSGSRIALAYAPELKENQRITLDRMEIMATYRRIAEAHGIPFWDFSDVDLCNDRRWFYNSQHLNAAGVDRFTPMIADSIAAWYRTR